MLNRYNNNGYPFFLGIGYSDSAMRNIDFVLQKGQGAAETLARKRDGTQVPFLAVIALRSTPIIAWLVNHSPWSHSLIVHGP
jgi:hypothetical protein